MALSKYDQSVYDAGYKYIPQSQYLLNPFQVPKGSENEVPTGIATTYQAQNMMGGGGGGFNPYNADMSQIRTDYNPRYDFRLFQDFGVTSPDQLTTEQAKEMGQNQGYYMEPPKTGIGAAFNKIADFIPYFGTVKRIAGAFKDMIPPNRRAILENELRGSGVLTDNIGRIVAGQGGYNTPQGIMAGYNPVNMTAETFDKRTGKMRETLKGKYKLSDTQIDKLISGELDEDDFTGDQYKLSSGKISNLFSNIRNIELAKRNFLNKQRKADKIVEFEKAQRAKKAQAAAMARAQNISRQEAQRQQQAIQRDYREDRGGDARAFEGSKSGYNEGNYCFDPNTLIQMADGSEKKIKEIQLGDQTKGGEVTGVFQFKASDEIHDYKGVTVAGSHYVKEDGRFIMVKDSPISVKIDKIPVVYSLDTTGRRIFIKDIEFADYNGDGIAKGFLANAGLDLSGFDKEVLRQVENRLI